MIDWWGPITWEYYAGTEGMGMTLVGSADWLSHKGAVGRAVVGVARICDDDGNELPAGQNGSVYFSDGKVFEYHNDPEKTAAGRTGADRLLPRATVGLQVPALHRLRGRAATPPDRQAVQAAAARALLERPCRQARLSAVARSGAVSAAACRGAAAGSAGCAARVRRGGCA